MNGLNLSHEDAESVKRGDIPEGVDSAEVRGVVEETNENIAAELHRQVRFFFNASGLSDTIEKLYITGGGALAPGLSEELAGRTGIPCKHLDPFRKVQGLDGFEDSYIASLAPFLGVSVGLATRQLGDKSHNMEESEEA